MNEENNPFLRSKRFVTLNIEEDAINVTGAGLQSTLLLPAPASRIDWLGEAASRMWRRRQRCVAALLILHPPAGNWSVRFPRQRCCKSGVSWTITEDDFAGLTQDWVLGGTFQSTSVGADALTELVPAPDGLHFVLAHADRESQMRAFVRAGGVLQPAGQRPVMINDWSAAIDAAMPRLTLA